MSQFRELKKGDLVIFNRKSGSGSFVKVVDKGLYFMPAKKDMRLDGLKFPIRQNEVFVYMGYKVLYKSLDIVENDRVIKINLLRETTNQVCSLSENDLHNYFSYYVRKYHEVYTQ
jgi:hypothetical protein